MTARSIRPWIPLAAVALLVLAVLGWQGLRSTRPLMCVRCRLWGEAEMLGRFRIGLNTTPNDCSRWYAETLDEHEHAWRPSGCVFRRRGLATSMALPANLTPLLDVTDEEQLAALRAFDDAQRERFFELAASPVHGDQERAPWRWCARLTGRIDVEGRVLRGRGSGPMMRGRRRHGACRAGVRGVA